MTGNFEGNVFGCRYRISATANGEPGTTAVWLGGRVDLTTKQDQFTHADTLSAAAVATLFGSNEIASGQTQHAQLGSGFVLPDTSWFNAMHGAHLASWLFNYRTGTQVKSATFTVDCRAPELTTGSTPAIAAIVLSPDRLTFGAAGDVVPVRVSVTDQFGKPVLHAVLSWATENPGVAVTGEGAADPEYINVSAKGPGTTQLVLTARLTAIGQEVRKSLPVTVLSFKEAVTDFGRTCGIQTDGKPHCWGDNTNGALGDGTMNSRVQAAPVSTKLEFSQLSIGRYNVCGVTLIGQAYCWGQNAYGELGDGSTEQRSLTPIPVSGGQSYVSVSTGMSSSCALTSTGEAYCWGANFQGELGNDTLTSTCRYSGASRCSSIPIRVSEGLRFDRINMGNWNHACGITAVGDVYCWGQNAHGQLGTSVEPTQCVFDLPCVRAPVLVEGGVKFSAVTAGFNFTCGLDLTGRAYCWGQGFSAQSASPATSRPTAVAGGLTFSAVDAGDRSVCGLTATGSIYCWGGSYGATPVATHTDQAYTGLSVGEGRVCGLTRNGGVFCRTVAR